MCIFFIHTSSVSARPQPIQAHDPPIDGDVFKFTPTMRTQAFSKLGDTFTTDGMFTCAIQTGVIAICHTDVAILTPLLIRDPLVEAFDNFLDAEKPHQSVQDARKCHPDRMVKPDVRGKPTHKETNQDREEAQQHHGKQYHENSDQNHCKSFFKRIDRRKGVNSS